MASLDNSYFLNGYRTFVSYHVETFGNMPIPTYEEWLRTFTRQEDRNSPHVLTEHPQTSQSFVSEPESECLSIVTQIMIADSITSLPSFLFQNIFQNILHRCNYRDFAGKYYEEHNKL